MMRSEPTCKLVKSSPPSGPYSVRLIKMKELPQIPAISIRVSHCLAVAKFSELPANLSFILVRLGSKYYFCNRV